MGEQSEKRKGMYFKKEQNQITTITSMLDPRQQKYVRSTKVGRVPTTASCQGFIVFLTIMIEIDEGLSPNARLAISLSARIRRGH